MPATRHILALILALGLLPGTALAQQAMQHQGHMGGMAGTGERPPGGGGPPAPPASDRGDRRPPPATLPPSLRIRGGLLP